MALLNSLSTGADDGKVVLYLKNICLTIGTSLSDITSFSFELRYVNASTPAVFAVPH